MNDVRTRAAMRDRLARISTWAMIGALAVIAQGVTSWLHWPVSVDSASTIIAAAAFLAIAVEALLGNRQLRGSS